MELETFLRILIQKWRILVSIFIITFLATLILTLNQPRTYEANATYVAKLSPAITDNRDFAAVINALSSRTEISTTYAEVANSRRIKTLAGEKLNLPQEALNKLSVSSRLIPGSNIIEIAVQGRDPMQVRDFANAVGDTTVEYAASLYEAFALDPLDEAGTPRWPIRPKVGLNLLLGAILGLILGSGITLLIFFLQTSEKGLMKLPDDESIPEVMSTYESAIVELRQDITTLQEQAESMGHVLKLIQSALRRTNSYARDIRSVVYELEERFDGNHSATGEAKQVDELDDLRTESPNE